MKIITDLNYTPEIYGKMFEQLSQKIRKEVHLLPQNPENLILQTKQGLSVLALLNEEIMGHATLWHIADGWYELGTTFVDPNHRGHHINFFMYEQLLEQHKEKNILATTTNQKSIHIGERLGFSTVRRNSLPAETFKGTCICKPDKTGSNTPLTSCGLAWNEDEWNPFSKWKLPCHVRVTKETIERNPDLVVIQNYNSLVCAKNPK